jgi:hypothetical protein
MKGNDIFVLHKGWWIGLYLFSGTILIYLALSHHGYDDPFITYRYADNLRNGLGFVYNPGERVLSTTTPLFAILLALLGNFGLDFPLLANLIGAMSIAAGGLFLWGLGQVWEAPAVSWCGLLLYPTFSLLLSTLGSETPLFLAFALGAFWLYARQRYGWAVFLVALAVLTRSDGVLLAAVLSVHYLWVNRNHLKHGSFWRAQPWKWIALALGILLVWHVFAWGYFGAPLPITLAAKQAQGRMAISQQFAPGVVRVAGWYAGSWQYWVQLGLAGIGIAFAIIKQRRWLLILAWTGLYFLAYSLLGVTSYFWYYAPLVPGWVVSVGLGLSFLSWLPLPGRLRTSHLGNKIQIGLVVVLIGVFFLGQVADIQKMGQRIDPRYTIYRAVGEWLAVNTPADARVGALEIGIIGYFSQRPIVDFAGLIQPDVADLMQTDTTYDDTALWAVKTYKPEYLALVDSAHPRLESEVVSVHCQSMKFFRGEEYNFSTDMWVYACQYP